MPTHSPTRYVTATLHLARPRSHRVVLTALAVLILVLNAHAVVAETNVPSKIAEVTVYRDQARIVRVVQVPASDSVQQIRVSGLPAQLTVSSVFSESSPGTSVRGLRIDASTMTGEVASLLEKLREKQDELLKRRQLEEQNLAAIEQDLLTIEKLVDFSSDKVKQNLDRATLDVQSVTALADFTMERRRKLSTELQQKRLEIDQLEIDLEQNETQQTTVMTDKAGRSYDALLAVSAPRGGTVRIIYDVSNVHWMPRYNVRAVESEDGKRTFTLQLDAAIVQDSGEPWDDVAVTLSTSTPSAQADRPLLTPLRVRAATPGETPAAGPATASGLTSNNLTLPPWLDAQTLQRNAELNTMANERQVSELTTVAEVQRELAGDAAEDLSDERYAIEGTVQIKNNPQVQTIAILTTELAGQMNHVVTPLLSSFAFREAELTNTSGRNLIAGAADVYLDGQFVGRTTVSPTASGQRMTVGFGTDRKVRTRRELMDKQETVQGGNRRSTLKYRLVIANYYDAPVDIRLLDRIPVAAKDGSITVDLDKQTMAELSEDALYVRMQKPTGVLRWDLQIPAKRFASDAFDHEYSYSIELDRQQTIVGSDLNRTIGDLQFQSKMGGGMGGMGGGFM